MSFFRTRKTWRQTKTRHLSEGTRVRHATFGEGEILSVRNMGGDFLYEVQFDTGVVKKLMATFAKLKKV